MALISNIGLELEGWLDDKDIFVRKTKLHSYDECLNLKVAYHILVLRVADSGVPDDIIPKLI